MSPPPPLEPEQQELPAAASAPEEVPTPTDAAPTAISRAGSNDSATGEEPAGEEEAEAAEEDETKEAGVHKGQDGWTAVWSAEANAYYYWNSVTNLTTWENPLANVPVPSTSAPLLSSDGRPVLSYDGIDPDLAYLDPSLSRSMASTSAGGGAPVFQARFNSRTGRFQGDPSMNPDRISDFKRAERQQEAYYDTAGWQGSLEGKGLKRSGEDAEGGGKKKRPSAKEVAKFKANKVEKKKKRLTAFLAT